MSSPWENAPAPVEDHIDEVVSPTVRQWGLTGGIPSVKGILNVEFVVPRTTISLVGAHGGAGTTTLSLLTGLEDADHSWPVTFPERANDVLIVARSNVWGLQAARTAAQELYAGRVVGVNLLGLVMMADVPGRRLPKELEALVTHVAGAFPQVWRIPWVDGWRFGELTRLPSRVERVIDELTALNNERGAGDGSEHTNN